MIAFRVHFYLLLGICLAFAVNCGNARAQPPDDAELEGLNSRVLTLLQAGQYPDAIPLAEKYVAATQARFGENAPQMATALSTHAVLLGATNHFAEAESLMRRALDIDEKNFGPDHPSVAVRLYGLAQFLQIRNRPAEAEPLMRRALKINEKNLGPDDMNVAVALNGLAALLKDTNRLDEAEPLMRRALTIFEKSRNPSDPNIAITLNGLASLLQIKNRLTESETLMRRALAIGEKNYGPDHPFILPSLGLLAGLLKDTDRFDEAEFLSRRGLAIAEKAYGSDHTIVAVQLNNLAGLLKDTNRVDEAEPLIRRALAITEKSLGPDHPNVATTLDALAGLLQMTGRLEEAEPLIRRALTIEEKSRGPDHPAVAARLSSLATLLQITTRFEEAEPLMRRALEIDEKSYGPDHPNVAIRLTGLAFLLQATNRFGEAEPLMRRALEIDEKSYGPDHSNVAVRLTGLAIFLQAANRSAEAEPMMRRALAIFEKTYGPDHPNTATSLIGLARLLQESNRLDEAEPLLRRALGVFEKSYGPDSFFLGITLNNLAQLLQSAGRLNEAEPVMLKTTRLLEKVLGPDHPLVATSLNNLAALKEEQGEWNAAAAFYAKAKPIMTGARAEGQKEQGEFAKIILNQNLDNLKGYARALYHASPADAAARAEAFELAQWALQNQAADALAAMTLRFARGEGRLASLVREEQDLRAARTNAYRQLDQAAGKADAKPAEAARRAIAKITAKLDHADASLRQNFPDYASLASPRPLGLTEAQALLGEGQALVLFLDVAEYSKVPEETIIFAMSKDQAGWLTVPYGTRALRQRVKALRCGLDSSNWGVQEDRETCRSLLGVEVPEGSIPPFDVAAAHSLYRDLFGGIEEITRHKSLLIVPSGALTQLPFQVLATSEPENALPRFEAYKHAAWLGQRQAITVLPSVASLKALRNATASRAVRPFVGFGNPLVLGASGQDRSAFSKQACPAGNTYHIAKPARALSFVRGTRIRVEKLRRQEPLPETADELCATAEAVGVSRRQLHTSVYLGERATVSQVKALSREGFLASAKIVHFATHGLLAGETALFLNGLAEPSLLLTPPEQGNVSENDNGLLTASEVAQLKLDADWVIMSACNTAAGQGTNAEALSGLARAFFYAGARSLLVSHWYVDSNAAVSITTGAVNAMRNNLKFGRAEALRQSISALIAKGKGWNHPSVWAPFVLVGTADN